LIVYDNCEKAGRCAGLFLIPTFKAFSSEEDAGSREENAPKQ